MKEAWWVTFRLPGRGKNGTSMSGAQLSQHWQLVLLSCALLIGNRSETVGGSIGGAVTCVRMVTGFASFRSFRCFLHQHLQLALNFLSNLENTEVFKDRGQLKRGLWISSPSNGQSIRRAHQTSQN